MKKYIALCSAIICVLLFKCDMIHAEYISESEYRNLAKTLYEWETVYDVDTTYLQREAICIAKMLESYSQIHEYTIAQDNTNTSYINRILIVVKENVYSAIPMFISRYAHDIHNEYGCIIDIVSVEGETPAQIKSLIQTYSEGLNGVVLIGDIAPAYYYHTSAPEWNEDTFPCDLFYMDLDGLWIDGDANGIYDLHIGNVEPEIFVGRINTAGMGRDEIQELRYYFDKNHKYWTGKKRLNKQRALTFTETDWNNSTFWNSVSPLYGSNKYDVVKADMFFKSDYLNYLQSSTYEFIQIACHSWYDAHDFEIGGVHTTVYNTEIATQNKRQIGYNLFCCKACRWTENPIRQCLGESYLYASDNNSSALALVGSTKTGGMLGLADFYTPLGMGKCIGTAFYNWWISHCGVTHTAEEKRWFYGMVILGDPLVDFNFTNDCDDILYLNDGEEATNNMYYAQSKIVVQDYSLTQGQSVTLSAPTIQITGPFVCSSGSSFNATPSDSCICNSASRKKLSSSQNRMPVRSKAESDVVYSIYPNPVTDILTIDTEEQLNNIVILNQSGQCVLQTCNTSINVSHLHTGIYIVRAMTKNGAVFQSKIIHK